MKKERNSIYRFADMCETFQDGSGKKVRGRSYPWGTVSLKIIELCLVNVPS